jgi:hypothetical protein
LAGFVRTLAAMNNDATIHARLRSAESPAFNPTSSPNSITTSHYMPIRRRKISPIILFPFGASNPGPIMRLLERKNDEEFTLTKDIIDNIPHYAILSHTWEEDTEEVTFRDLMDSTGKDKTGYSKIRFCGEQARHDGLQYFWVDTCCIDKSNNTELAEAINSMFRWYRNAAKCYVYLSDVPRDAPDTDDAFCQLLWESAFRKSR